MKKRLEFGEGRIWELDVPAGSELSSAVPQATEPLADLTGAVRDGLMNPLDFPPLSSATVPDDQVVLAVGSDVPLVNEILTKAIEVLSEDGTDSDNISVLLPETGGSDVEPLEEILRDELPRAIHIMRHDPGDKTGLSFLAASKENKPIYVNRQLFDADLIVPIGCLRPDGSFGYHGVYGDMFPTFFDLEAQRRYRAPDSYLSPVQHRRRCAETKEAAWLLGLQFVLQVVPDYNGSIHRILAGLAETVARKGAEVCEQAWLYRLAEPADFVIATISGGAGQQTWENFGRALAVSLNAVEDGGAILLCTDLNCAPGAALQQLVREQPIEETMRQLRRERGVDAVSAALLCEALERCQVYLISGHDAQTVEDLGVGYVAEIAEVERLMSHFARCLFIRDAHRAAVKFRE